VYHATVRLIARRAFRQLSDGDLDVFMKAFAPDAVFCFEGRHALGGELHGTDMIRALAERQRRLFPHVRIEPQAVVVGGWPWNTILVTRFTVRAPLPDGSTYANDGMQFARIRWGKVVEERLYEDTPRLADALDIIALSGNDEAVAPPISSAATVLTT
jgi:ketosteroid isomerase-like protein